MSLFANRVLETAPAPGLNVLVALGGAAPGMQPFSRSAFVDGQQVAFYISDGTQTEHCVGVWSKSGGTVSRDNVLWNSRDTIINPTKLNFTSAVQVYCDRSAQLAPAITGFAAGSVDVAGGSTGLTLCSGTFKATGTNVLAIATARVHYASGAQKQNAAMITMMLSGYQPSGSSPPTDSANILPVTAFQIPGVLLSITDFRTDLTIGVGYNMALSVSSDTASESYRIESPVVRLFTF